MISYLWVLASGGLLLRLSRAGVIATVLILDLLLLGTSAEHGEDAVLHVGGGSGHSRSSSGSGTGGALYYGLRKSACTQCESIKLEMIWKLLTEAATVGVSPFVSVVVASAVGSTVFFSSVETTASGAMSTFSSAVDMMKVVCNSYFR
jgi:hypothetical protein